MKKLRFGFLISGILFLSYCSSVDRIKNPEKRTLVKQDSMAIKRQNINNDTTIYTIVEKMPVFPGGDVELRKHIAENIDFSNLGIVEPWGKAYVKFMITKSGETDSIKVMNKVPKKIKERIYKVIKDLPKWQPGEHRGHLVNVWQTITINEPL